VKVFHPKSKSAPEALLRAAQLFAQSGERDNARRLLRSILQEYGSSAAAIPARTELARIYFEEGNLDLAQNELKRVIEGDPSPDARAQALLILANIHKEMGRSDQAKSAYQEIITTYKSSSALQGAYLNYARLLTASGNHKEAVDHLKKALALTKGVDSTLSKEALFALGDAQLAQKDAANSASTYTRFVEAYPRDEQLPQVLARLAHASALAGNLKKSNDACQQLLKLNASDPLRREALLRLAQNARASGAHSLAVQYYTRFTDAYPEAVNTSAVLFETARVAEQDLRDPHRAAVLYDLLGARYNKSALADDAALGAARCSDQTKEYDRALELYRAFIRDYPASELRPSAEERIRMIETFEAKNKDAGLEKLAFLVGDVVSEKNKSDLSRRLAEISFHDLRNFDAAARQFGAAIEGGLSDSVLADALYLRARSLEYLSWKNKAVAPQAVEAYRAFFARFPADERNEEAQRSYFDLNATSLTGARAAYGTIMTIAPASPNRAYMLVQLGRLLERADSADAALAAFTEASRIGPAGPAAEDAGFHRFSLLNGEAFADSALNVGAEYVKAFSNGRYTARVLADLGELALRGGKAADASTYLEQLVTEFPYTAAAVESRRRFADALLASGNTTAAIARYQELLEEENASPASKEQPDAGLLLSLGKALAIAGDTRNAKSSLFALLAREQKGEMAAEALTALGMMYKNEGNTEIAASYFRQAGQASPGTASSREIADMLFESGEYKDAGRQYAMLAANTTDEAERRYYRTRLIVGKLRSNDLAGADKDIAPFLKDYGESETELAQFELERGNSFFRENDYARALKSFQKVASSYDDTPSAPAAIFWIGKVYEATDKPKEAIEQFELLMKEHPNAEIIQKAHFALGNIYYRAEKWDEAVRNYRQVTDNKNADPALLPFAINNLIETYETAGIFDAALTLTRRYLELYPNSEDAFDKRIKIGILYQRLGYYDQSVLHLQALLDEAGSDLEGEIRYYIAEANFYKGDYQQAILDFLKVPYLVTKKGKIDWTATSLYMSGQAYEKMGRSDQALTMYQQIIDRSGIDATFKAAARKEIDRVNAILKGSGK
ncbi:MAG: Tetratricopeptide repeat-containing protein, partial [Bacteroidetes bacterium]|nr:Tetratricopeptide repeat-containing protein [Bacteroidota bacterium]